MPSSCPQHGRTSLQKEGMQPQVVVREDECACLRREDQHMASESQPL